MRGLVFVIAIATTHVASAGNSEVSVGSSNRALRSSSADAVTDETLMGGTVGVARQIGVALPVDHLALWTELGLAWGSANGAIFQTLTTDVGGTALTGGVRLRYTPYRHVAATVRVAIGSERASLTLRDGAGHSASDHAWGGLAEAALGADLLAVDRPGFALGLRFEFGYLAASSVALTATPDRMDDTLKIPMTEAALGHLDLSGPYFDVGLFSQF